MLNASLSPILTLLMLLLTINVHAQQKLSAIRGALSEKGKPITEATVFLQSFEDERCANLFLRKRDDSKSAQALQRCMNDENSSSSNDQGQYQFFPKKPGWYAVHFLWNIEAKPSHPMTSFKQGNWVVLFAGTGKYDTMAQDRPLYFSGEDDIVRNFDRQ